MIVLMEDAGFGCKIRLHVLMLNKWNLTKCVYKVSLFPRGKGNIFLLDFNLMKERVCVLFLIIWSL